MMLNSYTTKLLSILLVIIFANDGCKKKSEEATPTPGANEVWMQSNAFTPSSISVSVNTTIKWINKDNTNHTVTSNTGTVLNSATLGNGATFSHQFTTTGTFNYHCDFHSGMTGTVIVH